MLFIRLSKWIQDIHCCLQTWTQFAVKKKYISTVMYSTVHAYVSVYHLRYKVPQKRVINFTYTKTTFRLIVFSEEWRHPKHECTEGREPCLILRGPLNGWLDLSVSFLCFYKSMYWEESSWKGFSYTTFNLLAIFLKLF